MKNKLKGCRPSEQVNQEWLNTLADYGVIAYKIKHLPEDAIRIDARITELKIELDESRRQEALNKAEDSVKSEATT